MKMLLNLVLVCFAVIASISVNQVHSSRILAIFPFPGKSHQIMFDAMILGLSRRGHQVDVISHFPMKTLPPNVNYVVSLQGTVKSLVNSFHMDFVTNNLSQEPAIFISTLYGNDLCELMGHEKMRRFIDDIRGKDSLYDLVITEAFGANCYMGFGHFVNAPVVFMSSAQVYPWVDDYVANPSNLAVTPNAMIDVKTPMSFKDRLYNFYSDLKNEYLFNSLSYEEQTNAMRKYLSPDMPDIRQIEKSVALGLINSYHSFNGIRPNTAAFVEVGGLHVEIDDTKLPEDLKKWLDESTDGVIYFSLGSLVIVESMKEQVLLGMYKAFEKIAPTRVLIKVADPTKLPPGLPKNVKTLPWIPQIPVLRHNNTKVFITHGGLMGSQEALYYGVPLIGIPLFGDQSRNIANFVVKNMGVELKYDTINEKTLGDALETVLNDPKYRKAANRESALFRDRPMKAMDTAIYYLEYVIRNGPNSLRSPAVDMPRWQQDLLDIYAFLSIIIVVTIATVIIITRCLMSLLSKPTKRSVTRDKKQK